MKKLLVLLIASFLVATCATIKPGPSSTPLPPTVPSQEDAAIEVGEVIFDGTECTVSGLTELLPGRYSYVLVDLSDDNANLFVGRLTEGKTFQDMLDLQGEPGGYVPFIDDSYVWAVEPGIAWQKPDGGEVHTYILTEEGEYTVGLWSWVTVTTPEKIWFCAPIWVKVAPSD